MPCISVSDIEHKVKHSCETTSPITREMPQSLYSFPSRTNPQTTLKSKDFAFSPTPTNKSMHKSTTFDSNDKAEFSPVEIGTRDTVASLIMQDVEYFNKIGSNSYRNMSQIPKVSSSIRRSSTTTNGTKWWMYQTVVVLRKRERKQEINGLFCERYEVTYTYVYLRAFYL